MESDQTIVTSQDPLQLQSGTESSKDTEAQLGNLKEKSIKLKTPLMDLLRNSRSKIHVFKKVFSKSLGHQESVIFDCPCALVKDVYIQGRLFLTKSHLCFYGRILKWSKTLHISFGDILSIKKARKLKMPAIEVALDGGQLYYFSFFPSFRGYFSKIHTIWQTYNREDASSESQKSISEDISTSACLSTTNDSSLSNNSGSGLISDTPQSNESQARDGSWLKESNKESKKVFSKKCFSTGDLESHDKFTSTNLLEADSGSVADDSSVLPCSYTGSGTLVANFNHYANPDKVFQLYFNDQETWKEFNATHNFTVKYRSEWKKLDTTNSTLIDGRRVLGMRKGELALKVSLPFAKNILINNEEVAYLTEFNPNHSYQLKLVVVSSGAPLTSTFYTISTVCIHKGLTEGESNIHTHFDMIFTKRTWGMQSLILESSRKLSQDKWADRAYYLNEILRKSNDYFKKPGVHESMKIFSSQDPLDDQTTVLKTSSKSEENICRKRNSTHIIIQQRRPHDIKVVANNDSYHNKSSYTHDQDKLSSVIQSEGIKVPRINFRSKVLILVLFVLIILNSTLLFRLWCFNMPSSIPILRVCEQSNCINSEVDSSGL